MKVAADPNTPDAPPARGQILFALFFLGLSLFLLSQIGGETRWVENTQLAAQPRFWPAVGLVTMLVFGALHLVTQRPLRLARADWSEALNWVRVTEYAGWFLVYVLAVPVVGYLPATLLFLPALVWREGYRGGRILGIAALFGLLVVVFFKSFLSVKIPGGALYDYLPGALRNFAILNL